MENNLEEVLFQMVKSFVYKENRQPKIIILDWDKWKEFAYINNGQHLNINKKVTEGKFMMCKVINSNNVESIEIY